MPENDRIERRRVLGMVGAVGLTGILAGCLGDDEDDTGDDSAPDDGDDSSADDGDDGDEEVGTGVFQVSGLEPDEVTVRIGDNFDVTAEVTNTDGDTGVQDVSFQIGGEVITEQELTLEGFDHVDVDFSDIETDDLDEGEHVFGVYTNDDAAEGTLTLEPALSLEVTTEEASDVSTIGATLNGHVDSGGESVDAWFEWGEAGTDLENETEPTLLFDGGDFSERLDGLSLDTEYEFRAVAPLEEMEETGDTLSFTTPAEAAMVAHWPMDEGSGDSVSDAAGDEHGTIAGDGVEWVESNDWYGGYALENTNEGWVTFTTLGEFGEEMNSDFSIVYTIDSDDTSANGTVMSTRPGSGENDAGFNVTYNFDWMGQEEGAVLQINNGNASDAVGQSADGILADGPHRVAFNKITHDPGNWQLFVDGEEMDLEAAVNDGISSLPPLDEPLHLYRWGSGQTRFLEGILDNIMIFDDPLPASQIEDDYDEQPWS